MHTTDSPSFLQQLKALGIKPAALPETMPDELKELVLNDLTFRGDLDPEDDDTEEVLTEKQRLTEHFANTIQLVKDWQNDQETTLEDAPDSIKATKLCDLYAQAEGTPFRKGCPDGAFFVKPAALLELGIIDSLREHGKQKWNGFTFVKTDIEKFWYCTLPS